MEDQREQMWKVAKDRKARGDYFERNYEQSSSRRLMSIAGKKMKTSFIGDLDIIESAFGELWGHGKNADELTESEMYWREKWSKARAEILDNGNNQLRALLNEISEYTIKWNRYNMRFVDEGFKHVED